ncbi:multicopper oxidase domain-containing protein [Streptomyces sp. NPDC006186]|uniref:multicopper oxidase family protein n=1 Tax=Streptomyces sp. NPDC006186 TaxID=3155248 RepID=UPI0033B6C858
MGEDPGISRRSLVKALPVAGLAAMTGGLLGHRPAAAAPMPFPQPAVTTARRLPGRARVLLEQTLDVRWTDVSVPGHGTFTTRAYNGTLPGPTLRLRPGDTLRLTHVNGLPPNPPHTGGHNVPHHPNSFNVHTHGLHVSPSGLADNVLRAFTPRTAEEADAGAPEPRYVSVIDVPPDHPAGTYWYHPHLHGALAEQIAGGMAGVIVVEGDVDEVPEIRAADDIVVCVNELKTKNGKVPSFTSSDWLNGVASVFTVNGTVNPTLRMRPGQVQRWRLVAATAFSALRLRLTGPDDSLPLHQIAQDGITFAAPVTLTTLDLAMGNRADVLVRAEAPGTYELRSNGIPVPLMTVKVVGEPIDPPMPLPATLPQGRPFLDENEVAGPEADREVVFHADPRAFTAPFPAAFRILGTGATPAADPDGDPVHDTAYGLYDPAYVNHTLRLGTVERWTVRTDETVPAHSHPFHLHTNPVLLTHRNGVRLDPPVWHDTIALSGGRPGESVSFLVKYEDFTGRTIAHCHQLLHEDLGMMQTVEYVDGTDPAAADAGSGRSTAACAEAHSKS